MRSSVLVAFAIFVAGGCAGEQSALDPAGRGASTIARLFWVMTIGSVAIWAGVVGLAVYATYFSRGGLDVRQGRILVIGGGVLFPVAVLTVLLAFGLSMMPPLLAAAPPEALRIEVIAHQWWWRVRYLQDGGAPVELANEIHLPTGRPVEFQLESRDVIHSFWIPSLGGKMDMIPGRRTRLLLEPTKAGAYRGVCAEYCGASHAWMAFAVVVEDPADFGRWLERQASHAERPPDPTAERGAELLLSSGCGACHSVRGTPADGVVGPDLTHVGSRRYLAAGALVRDERALRKWIAQTHAVKPGAQMPAFSMLPGDDLDALAAYLEGLD
ncbi:MAG: cytochrome c oxidase subunit II [Candidatus Binatia bacterium]